MGRTKRVHNSKVRQIGTGSKEQCKKCSCYQRRKRVDEPCSKKVRRGGGGEDSDKAERKTNKSTGAGPVGNMGNKSHQAFYKRKVLTGYYFNFFMDLIFPFRDHYHVHFNLFFTNIRMLRGRESERDTTGFSQNLLLSLKMTVGPVLSPMLPVRKEDFPPESMMYYYHLHEISCDSLKL